MADRDPRSPKLVAVTLRYGIAVLLVTIALGSTLLLRKFELRESLFLMAIAVTVWFGGMGPGLLAIVLSILSIDYVFLSAGHGISVNLSHLPYLILFTLFALFISWLSASRRHAEQYLRQARNELQRKVAEQIDELREQARLLNLTHDSIFVRNTDDAITYWNRGAEELYTSYVQNGLTKDMFSRYVRLNKIQALMKDGQLDSDLRWRRSTVAV